jgi:hypothetical protein
VNDTGAEFGAAYATCTAAIDRVVRRQILILTRLFIMRSSLFLKPGPTELMQPGTTRGDAAWPPHKNESLVHLDVNDVTRPSADSITQSGKDGSHLPDGTRGESGQKLHHAIRAPAPESIGTQQVGLSLPNWASSKTMASMRAMKPVGTAIFRVLWHLVPGLLLSGQSWHH